MSGDNSSQDSKPAPSSNKWWQTWTFVICIALVFVLMWLSNRNPDGKMVVQELQGSPKSWPGAAPTTEEERLLANTIIETANDPRSVEFQKWGPNRDVRAFLADAKKRDKWDPGSMAAKSLPWEDLGWVIRLAHREKNRHGALERFDFIYFFLKDGKTILGTEQNPLGDQWANVMFPKVK